MIQPHRLLRQPNSERHIDQNSARELECSFRQLWIRHGAQCETDALSLLGKHRASGQKQFSRALRANTDVEPYETELRNQIRKAVRNEMKVTYELPGDAAEIPAAYREFVPLHRASWQRTGMPPHDERYWSALSRAVIAGGGRDLLAYVHDRDGAPAAAVVCHVRDGHALYWAGCSSEEGLRANANPLCLHAAIQACRAIGVRRFELGRFFAREPSEKERAITRYKAQFGGELVHIVGFEGGSGALAMLREQILQLRTMRERISRIRTRR